MHGADVIYDPVGGDVFDRSRKCIAFEGRLVVVGFTSGRSPRRRPITPWSRTAACSCSLGAVPAPGPFAHPRSARRADAAGRAGGRRSAGEPDAAARRCEAGRALTERGTVGKIVLVP